MAEWKKQLEIGAFQSDQQALDEAEILGKCPHTLVLSFRHLLFAKDYLMMIFRGGQTFTHFTAAGRKEDQDWFYGGVVMPRLRGGIRPKLNLDNLDKVKQCSLLN